MYLSLDRIMQNTGKKFVARTNNWRIFFFCYKLFTRIFNLIQMKQMDFQPQGTCSKLIHIELTDDDRVSDVSFVGGCPGNLKGISALIKGMHKDDVISRLCGIKCGNKSTSCPDQLACALKQMN